jgi:NTE family protein
MHGSFALERGVTLLIAINPIVPVEVDHRVDRGAFEGRSMLDRGLPTVLSQTFRTLIHSRMSLGWATYPVRYPDAKVILFEPDRADMHMFTTNIFSFTERKSVLEYAYRSTRRALRRRRGELEPILARHGIGYRWDVLQGERDLWTGVGLAPRRKASVTAKLGRALDRLEVVLDGV